MPRTQPDDDRTRGTAHPRQPRNPLRRPIDRVETILTAAIVILFATTVPLAVYAADAIHDASVHASEVAAASTYRTEATLLGEPERNPSRADLDQPVYVAAAEWRDHDGLTQRGDVPARPDDAKGETVPVWIDSDTGDAIEPPLDDEYAGLASVAFAVSLILTSLAIFGMAVAALRGRAEDIRLHAWEAEWAKVEPIWTRRTQP